MPSNLQPHVNWQANAEFTIFVSDFLLVFCTIFAPSKFVLIQRFRAVRVGGGGVMGRQQEFIFAKKLHWPTSSYNFDIGCNLTLVYFGRQLVAVKAMYFLSSITGPY